MPYLDHPGEGERRQDKGQNHGGNLGGNHNSLPVVVVGHDAAERGDEKYRELTGETDRTQQKRRPGQAIDQPRLGNGLHPGSNQRNELAAEEKLEVPVAQGAQGRGQLNRPAG